MMALNTLCGTVPPEMVLTIAKNETTKEVWDAIATMRAGNDRVKKAMTQQLCQKFDLATFNDGETIEDYAMRLSGMVVHLTMLGEEVKDGEIVAKML
jgi:predicted SpoU family rRNA methylase